MPSANVRTLVTALACLLVAQTAARAQTWKKHRYATDGFEVTFSGDVKVTPTQIDAETKKRIVRSTDYQQDSGDVVYIVGASLVVVEVNFDNGVKQSFAALKCKTTTRDTALALRAGRGREVHGTECHDGHFGVEARYYTRGKWFYQIIALFKKGGGHERGARTFVESFKVID